MKEFLTLFGGCRNRTEEAVGCQLGQSATSRNTDKGKADRMGEGG